MGLAPPTTKPIPALPTLPLSEVVTRSHAVLRTEAQKEKLLADYLEAKRIYEQEHALAVKYNYVDGKTRIPKRLPIKRDERKTKVVN